MRLDIGKLMDVLSQSMDEMQAGNKNRFRHLPYGNPVRLGQYGRWLREYFKATFSRFEWLTIQLKCLSRGDITSGHLDSLNDRQPGYNITGGLCFIFMDGFGDYWSLKFIVNSRKVIGDHLIPSFFGLYSGMLRQIDSIDSCYSHLMNVQYKGNRWRGVNAFSARNFRFMFLDDDMPWKEEILNDVGTPIVVRTFSIISAIQRDLFLSLILSGIKELTEVHNLTLDSQLEFAITASYLNSFKRFYYVMTCREPKDYVACYMEMTKLFGTFKGGTDIRYSASGIDFEKVFIKKKGKTRMDLAVAQFKSLFNWMNRHRFEEDPKVKYGRKRDVTTVEEFQQRTTKTLNALKGHKMEINEFRLLLITQICALGGIFLKEHPILTKFMYVVKGTGGYKFLAERSKQTPKEYIARTVMKSNKVGEVKFTVSQSRCIMDSLAFALEIDGADRVNGMECLACESQESRREESVRDVFVYGQKLYTLGADGKQYVKHFGSHMWLSMFPSDPEVYTQPFDD